MTSLRSEIGAYELTSATSICLLVILLTAIPAVGRAGELSPVGFWTTIDSSAGTPEALVRIDEKNGEYTGTIVRLFDPTDDPDSKCEKCTDYRKNQPVVGMMILSGMRQHGEQYDGGEILDPDSGSVYKSVMRLQDGGRELVVRGYLGVSLFGRSETWVRAAQER
jgi:uncharacterized protein (DUF2147 family)